MYLITGDVLHDIHSMLRKVVIPSGASLYNPVAVLQHFHTEKGDRIQILRCQGKFCVARYQNLPLL